MAYATKEERLFHSLARIGRYDAARCGVPADDLDDCASDFALTQWTNLVSKPQALLEERQDAWIHRCARNHAISYLRKLAKRATRETCFHELDASSGCVVGVQHFAVIESELSNLLSNAISRLTPDQASVIVGRYVLGIPISDLAERYGRSPDAVSKLLVRGQRRLHDWLLSNGMSLDDFQEYVQSLRMSKQASGST